MDEHSSRLSTWVYHQLEGRETLKWLVSHVFTYLSMIFLITGYCVVGAYTFQYLENSANNAKHAKDIATDCWGEVQNHTRDNRTALLHKLYNITEKLLINQLKKSLNRGDSFNHGQLDDWALASTTVIAEYEKTLKQLYEESVRCGVEQAAGDDWDFKTSLLFATTVVTTIGYGNRTPQSWQGRLATLLYAMLGVPLMLFCVRSLGRAIGYLLAGGYRAARERWLRWPAGGPDADSTPDWTDAAGQDGVLAVPAAVAAGRSSAGEPRRPPGVSVTPADESEAAPGEERRDETRHGHRRHRRQGDQSDDRSPGVPLGIVFFVTTLYTTVGAVLFAHYEEWSFLDGFYFTFITISTIGFGDLVPRMLSSRNAGYGATPTWWVGASYVVYVLVGLTVIQMSFELTRESINSEFYRIGRAIGVVGASQAGQRSAPLQDASDEAELEGGRHHKSRRHQRHDSYDWIGSSTSAGRGTDQLDPNTRSPSMRSAEPSTAPSSVESVPRPKRPRSARPRK